MLILCVKKLNLLDYINHNMKYFNNLYFDTIRNDYPEELCGKIYHSP